jgi:hypothetical protein
MKEWGNKNRFQIPQGVGTFLHVAYDKRCVKLEANLQAFRNVLGNTLNLAVGQR